MRFKLFCFLLCFVSFAQAHNFAPSLLELRQQPGGVIELLWRTPIQTIKQPQPVLPQDCRRLSDLQQSVSGSAAEYRYSFICAGADASLRFSVAGLSESKTSALLRWYTVAGGRQQSLLRADSDYFIPQVSSGVVSAFAQFSALGISHILVGSDHLLFVLGLLMLAAGLRQLIVLITSFTLGHSLSLALVVLGFIPYLPSLAEWLIALSVLIMASYLGAGQHQARRGLTLLAGGFGLLHGLGFAGVLNTLLDDGVGLVPALLGFNVGVELGQLLFIAVVAGFAWVCKWVWGQQVIKGLRWAAIYAMGSVSVFWLLDRGLKLFEAALDLSVY